MTLWTVLIDVGLMSLLLLIGVFLRAKVKFIQMLFLPASLIAGILALAFGPNGLGIIPFSGELATYSSILIALVFSALPFTSKFASFRTVAKRVSSMWSFAQTLSVLEWGLGLLFALLILKPFWSDLPDGFGLMLATGFVGGHGTAAAIGSGFGDNFSEALSLGMTSATVGIIAAIVGGILIIKWETRKGNTSFITNFSNLSNELRTGLISVDNRRSMGENTVSSISVDPLIFHSAVLILVAMTGYSISEGVNALYPALSLPVFSVSFIVGYILLFIFKGVKAEQYFDKQIFERISGSSTDLLVGFGVASINLAIVVEYALPLALLLLFGIGFVFFMYKFMAPMFFKEYHFEKGIFSWGWGTGTVAMGIALLRIVDPEIESGTLDEYGLAYIPISLLDIVIISLAPILVISGFEWHLTLALLFIGGFVLIGTKMLGWWGRSFLNK